MTDRDILAAARSCAARGMCAASLMQVFELSEAQADRILAERGQAPATDAVPATPTEETPPCPLN